MLDELSALSDPLYLWMNMVGFLALVGFFAWTAIGRHRPEEQGTAAAVQENRLAA